MQVATMYYVVPRAQQDALRGSVARPSRNVTVWGVFATASAAWDFVQRTNRRLCAAVVPL